MTTTSAAGTGNHVVVVPTEDTLSMLKEFLLSAPLLLDAMESLHVTLFYSKLEKIMQLDPTHVYRATPVMIKPWYDTGVQHSKLSIFLESQEITDRHYQLESQYGTSTNTPSFNPHLTLSHNFPGMSSANKSFYTSLADALILNSYVLEFHNEMALSSIATHVSMPDNSVVDKL